MIGYVIGANSPTQVMNGFIHRIWRNMGVDKVVAMGNGIFLIRFNTMEKRDEVLRRNRPLFDKKPFIIKPWTQDMDLAKEDVKMLPIWIQLHKLGFQY